MSKGHCIDQRVDQLEEGVRQYKRRAHRLLEENKQLQLEDEEEKLKELSQVYTSSFNGQLMQKLNKKVRQR